MFPQRVDIFGWDSDDREYFLLDDNRLYRRKDPSYLEKSVQETVKVKPKANSKKAKAAARAGRRHSQRAAKENGTEEEENGEEASPKANGGPQEEGMEWELVALTLNEYNDFLESLQKSRDTNEKNLRARITREVLPIIERAEEEQKRKALKKEREQQILDKLSNVKRSSRVAAKQEREKEEQEALDAAQRKLAEEIEARKAIEKRQKIETVSPFFAFFKNDD